MKVTCPNCQFENEIDRRQMLIDAAFACEHCGEIIEPQFEERGSNGRPQRVSDLLNSEIDSGEWTTTPPRVANIHAHTQRDNKFGMKIIGLTLIFGSLLFFTLFFLSDIITRHDNLSAVAIAEHSSAQLTDNNQATNQSTTNPNNYAGADTSPSIAPAISPSAIPTVEATPTQPQQQETQPVKLENKAEPQIETARGVNEKAEKRSTPEANTATEREPKTTPPEQGTKTTNISAADKATNEGAGNVTIQVGSYKEIAEANERVAALKAAGVEARVVRVEIPNRGTWYRVQVGRFKNNDEAMRHMANLRASGAVRDVWVTRSNKQQ